MKKTLLLLSLIISATVLHAQTQTPPPEAKKEVHPGWVFNGEQMIEATKSFTLGFKASVLNDFIYVNTHGGVQAINDSDLPGATRKALIASYNIVYTKYNQVVDSLSTALVKNFAEWIKKDQAQFTADTLDKYHPKLVIGSVKDKKGKKQ